MGLEKVGFWKGAETCVGGVLLSTSEIMEKNSRCHCQSQNPPKPKKEEKKHHTKAHNNNNNINKMADNNDITLYHHQKRVILKKNLQHGSIILHEWEVVSDGLHLFWIFNNFFDTGFFEGPRMHTFRTYFFWEMVGNGGSRHNNQLIRDDKNSWCAWLEGRREIFVEN